MKKSVLHIIKKGITHNSKRAENPKDSMQDFWGSRGIISRIIVLKLAECTVEDRWCSKEELVDLTHVRREEIVDHILQDAIWRHEVVKKDKGYQLAQPVLDWVSTTIEERMNFYREGMEIEDGK